jgi:hypothetical protein
VADLFRILPGDDFDEGDGDLYWGPSGDDEDWIETRSGQNHFAIYDDFFGDAPIIARIGTELMVSTTLNSGSQSITVPSGAACAVVGVVGSGGTADTVSLGGVSGVKRAPTSGALYCQLFTVTSPPAGSQSLAWSIDRTGQGDEACLIVSFYSGVDTSAPVLDGDSAFVNDTPETAITPSMTAQSGAMAVSVGTSWGIAINLAINGQTSIFTSTIDYASTDDQRVGIAEKLIESTSCDMRTYGGYPYAAACVLAPSTGGAGAINLAAGVVGQSATPDIAATLARELLAAITSDGSSPDFAAVIVRNLAAAITGGAITPDLAAVITLNLSAVVTGQSTTPDLTAVAGRDLSASVAGQSETPNLSAGIARVLLAAISGQSTTPDLTATILSVVTLTAAIAGASATPDIGAQTARSLSAAISGQSATQDFAAVVLRALLTSIAGQSATPDLTVTLSGAIQLTAAVYGVGYTGDLATQVARELAAHIAGQTDTATMWARIDRALTASIGAITFAPDTLSAILGDISPLVTVTARAEFAIAASPITFTRTATPIKFQFQFGGTP